MKQLKLKALDSEGPEGIFLVRVEAATYRWHGRKPFLHLQFSILAPSERRGQLIRAGLDCSAKPQWKLRWFLQDFKCPSDYLEDQAVDVRTLSGLTGVVRASLVRDNRRLCLGLDGFSPAATWPEFAEFTP